MIYFESGYDFDEFRIQIRKGPLLLSIFGNCKTSVKNSCTSSSRPKRRKKLN